jgi:hypothetical protein
MTSQEFDRANAEWLNAAIQRGDNIMMVTDPAVHTALSNEFKFSSRYLNLEIPMVEEMNAPASFKFPPSTIGTSPNP